MYTFVGRDFPGFSSSYTNDIYIFSRLILSQCDTFPANMLAIYYFPARAQQSTMGRGPRLYKGQVLRGREELRSSLGDDELRCSRR